MRLRLIITLLFISSFSYSQTTIKIWNKTNVKQTRSKLTIYLPEEENNTGISVIICPGGSYHHLGMKLEGHDVAQFMQQNGIAAFVLRYRVSKDGEKHPAMIQDLQRSIQLLKENSVTYNINPEKVGVLGFSAGGHLAGTASTYFDTNFMEPFGIIPKISLKPAFAGMIYPVITMQNNEIVHKRSRLSLLGLKPEEELKNKLSLELNARPDMNPIFLLHCQDDNIVNYQNSVNYAKALSAKNVPYEFKLFDEAGHGFGIAPQGQADGWQFEFLSWMKTVSTSSEQYGTLSQSDDKNHPNN